MKVLQIWRISLFVFVVAGTFLLAACSGGAPAPAATSPANAEGTQPAAVPSPTETGLPVEPTSAGVVIDAPAAPEPTAVDAGQDRGARDLENALAAFAEAPDARGDVLVLYGQVLNTNGEPLAGAAVEIWQTDASGIYDHPGAPGTDNRDLDFQFYGTFVTDEQGHFLFRTVMPQEYGSRPPHIHLKVKLEGNTRLTSQFYFEQNRSTLGSEPLFAQAGALGDLIILVPEAAVDAQGRPVLAAQKDIVIDLEGGEALTATPAQGEGPFYPVVDVSAFDNDLTRVK